MQASLYSAGLSANQPAAFFSYTESAPANQQYFYLTTNQHQLPVTASRTECQKDDLKHSKTNKGNTRVPTEQLNIHIKLELDHWQNSLSAASG